MRRIRLSEPVAPIDCTRLDPGQFGGFENPHVYADPVAFVVFGQHPMRCCPALSAELDFDGRFFVVSPAVG